MFPRQALRPLTPTGPPRSGVAILGLAALLGAVTGIGAAMLGSPPPVTPPRATAKPAPETTVVESGFWTAVIGSFESDRDDAEDLAERAVAKAAESGQEAFVLDGADYEGLSDEYLAVCVGRFTEESEAEDKVEELKELGFEPVPYVRDVGELSADADADGGGDGDEDGSGEEDA